MFNLDYLYNPEYVKTYYGKEDYFLDKKLEFQVIENGTILPHKIDIVNEKKISYGGIVDSSGDLIKSSCYAYGCNRAYTPPAELIQHSSETVIYLGLFNPCYGHVLTDDIRRVWFLKSEFFKNEFKTCPIVYIPMQRRSYRDLMRLLEILGVDVDRLRPITQPTQFNKIILPDESFISKANVSMKIFGFTNEYRETIDILKNFALKNRTPTSFKKCYFFYGRKGFGEEHLAEYFKSKGYEIITHEQRATSFDEELNIMINCESFVATGGSCWQNFIFLPNGAETILIPRTFLRKIPAQGELQIQVYPLINTTYVDSTLSIFPKNENAGPFLFIISEQLKRFFGDKFDGYTEEDFKTFLQYVKNSISNGYAFHPEAKMYYSPVLQDFMEQLKKREDLINACDMPPNWETFCMP